MAYSFITRPKVMVFFISFKCNLRCAMCYAWLKQRHNDELSLDQIKQIFNDRLFRNNLKVINITGGEPTLRTDLPDIIKIIINNCKRLERIDISTNGVNTPIIADQAERILAILLPTDVKLGMSISLDGVGEVHEQVRGVSNIFANVEQTIEKLKNLMFLYPFFSFGLNMTISRLNYSSIEEVRKYAMKHKVGINFTLAALSEIGVESIRVRERFEMGRDEKNKLVSILEDLSKKDAIDPLYLQSIITWLKTGKRQDACAFRKGKALLLDPDGEIYMCGNFKDFRIGNIFSRPLEKLLRNSKNIPRYAYSKCLICASNCYTDEAK